MAFGARGNIAPMIAFSAPEHALHAPQFEIFRGDRVPCFESPKRAEVVLGELVARGHEIRAPQIDSRVLLARVHTSRYLAFLEGAWSQWLGLDSANASVQPFPSVWPVRTLRSDREPRNFTARLGLYSMDNGSPLVAGTWSAAKAGADAAASAAALVSRGARAVFCATRPPGHHAGADFMGGYCFLNNAAVAAQGLLDAGSERVAILDVDYHHGNGTQSIFYERADVLFASVHGDPLTEYPFYLGHADETGLGAGEGFNLNLPLAARSSVETWFGALDAACAQDRTAPRRCARRVARPRHLCRRPDLDLRARDRRLSPAGRAAPATGTGDDLRPGGWLCGGRAGGECRQRAGDVRKRVSGIRRGHAALRERTRQRRAAG